MKGQKETTRTYCKHSRHLSIFGRSNAKSSSASSPSQLFSGWMIEFDGPMKQCFSRFLTVSKTGLGWERGE